MAIHNPKTSVNSARKQNWLKFTFRAIFTIAILSALFIWLPADELWTAIKKTGFTLWVLVLVGASLFHIAAGWKWKVLLVASGLKVKFLEALRAHTAGLFANIWLPSLTGGDLVRLTMVTKTKQQIASALTGSVTDRVNDVVSLLILTALGILWIPSIEKSLGTQTLVLITIIVVSDLFSAPVFLKYVHPNWFPKRFATAVTALKSALSAIMSKKKSMLVAQLTSLLIQSSFVMFNVAIGRAMGIEIPFSAWFFAWPLAKLAAMLPVSLGGMGVREAAMAGLLATFYVDPTLSVAQSLVWETVMLGLGLIAGVASIGIGTLMRQNGLETGRELKMSANNRP